MAKGVICPAICWSVAHVFLTGHTRHAFQIRAYAVLHLEEALEEREKDTAASTHYDMFFSRSQARAGY